MDITTLGNQSFRLKGKTAAVIADILKFGVEVDKKVKMEIGEPGEYEIGGISIIGFKFGENIIFVFEMDGFRIAYLGNFSGEISDEKVSQLGSIDLLIINVGINTKESVKMTSLIDPYFIFPFSEGQSIETFLSESGLTVEKMDKFSLKKEDILEDQSAKIILLPNK